MPRSTTDSNLKFNPKFPKSKISSEKRVKYSNLLYAAKAENFCLSNLINKTMISWFRYHSEKKKFNLMVANKYNINLLKNALNYWKSIRSINIENKQKGIAILNKFLLYKAKYFVITKFCRNAKESTRIESNIINIFTKDRLKRYLLFWRHDQIDSHNAKVNNARIKLERPALIIYFMAFRRGIYNIRSSNLKEYFVEAQIASFRQRLTYVTISDNLKTIKIDNE